MTKNATRAIAIALCAASVLSTEMYIAAPAYAQEAVTDTSIGKTPELKSLEVSRIPEGNAYIPKDTVLEVELMREIDSKHCKTGDPVLLRLVDNLIVNNVIVAPAGTEVDGVITKARKPGGLGRSGKLEFQVNSFKTINNIEVPLAYAQKAKGGTDGGAGVVFAAVSVVGGLFMKGKNVAIQSGTKFDCRVTTDTDLKVKLTNLKEAMNPDAPHGVAVTIQ
ncbi:MAG: hypothetical protein SOV43_09695 [Selenomonadaceae bacterium]|nr:hypothetical protein [Selenomonadaceae bacterium]